MKKLREHKTTRAWLIFILLCLLTFYIENDGFIYTKAIFAFCSLLWLIQSIDETFQIVKRRLVKTNWGNKIINYFLK